MLIYMTDGEEIKENASKIVTDRLVWNPANKNQAGIARDIADGKAIPEAYGLGEAGIFDEFFYFLDEVGVSGLFDGLDPKLKKRQSKISFHAVTLIYLMRIVSGFSFFWHIKDALLKSQALMHLVGFNGSQIKKGTSQRGNKKKPEQTDAVATNNGDIAIDDDSTDIRGPICVDFIADSIESIPATALEIFFNGVISILASRSLFPKKIHALLDASEIQTTEKCIGCGSVAKQKAPELRLRKGRIRKVVETVFGFKIWVVWEPNSKIPLAVRFTTIEVADIKMAQEVITQAIKNVGVHAKITSLALDRGFMDGKLLWWLNQQGMVFYIPAKKNMAVHADAISLADKGIHQTREKKRIIGHGKNKRTEIDYYEVAGVENLTSAGFYGELGSGSHENSKTFMANPINAVVILNDPFMIKNPNANTMVILTNGPVKKPFIVYDGYDERSEIENGLFREAKQAWFIQRAPRNSEKAYRAHVYLTLATMALTTTFRIWMDVQDKKVRRREDTGIRKFREKIRTENGNKVIVFNDGQYAIFELYELLILIGGKVLKPLGVKKTITKDDILRKYSVLLE